MKSVKPREIAKDKERSVKKNGTKRAKRSTKKSSKKQPEEVIDGPLNNFNHCHN